MCNRVCADGCVIVLEFVFLSVVAIYIRPIHLLINVLANENELALEELGGVVKAGAESSGGGRYSEQRQGNRGNSYGVQLGRKKEHLLLLMKGSKDN